MRIPLFALTRLSPTASKIYLALLALADHRLPTPAATIPLAKLANTTSLSLRTCAYALRQLRALHLITSQRRGKNSPCTYFLLHLQCPADHRGGGHDPQSHAPLTLTTCNPLHPSNLHPIAGHPTPIPVPAAKPHNLQSDAPSLPQLLALLAQGFAPEPRA